MEIYLIIFLSLITLGLIIYIIIERKKLNHILNILYEINKGEKRKAFIKGNGIVAKINYEINEVVSDYEKEILTFNRSEKLNKELLTNLSHDVRTPLTSLLGYLDALNNNVVEGNEREEYIKTARKKAYELREFVDTLFDWFKINSKEKIYKFEKIDINEYSREILVDWIPVFEENKVTLEVNISEEELYATVDKEGYKRIINNLIQNAIIHGKGNFLKINIDKKYGQINIVVEDNGVGIPEDKLPNIFERLYKCDNARSRRSSGLGLSIVKELVLAHKGNISAESIENEKTIFIVTLPI